MNDWAMVVVEAILAAACIFFGGAQGVGGRKGEHFFQLWRISLVALVAFGAIAGAFKAGIL